MPVFGAITLVGAACATDDDGDTVATTTGFDTSSATLFIVTEASGNILANPTDLVGASSNPWTPLTTYDNGGVILMKSFYSIPVNVGPGHTFSVTGATYPAICVLAFAGTHATAPFDQESGDTVTPFASTTFQPGSVTPSADNEVLVTGFGHQQAATATPDLSFIVPAGGTVNATGYGQGLSVAYKIQGAAAAQDVEWTVSMSVNGGTNITTWKEATAPAPSAGRPCCLGVF
jgi:hypothetical protein